MDLVPNFQLHVKYDPEIYSEITFKVFEAGVPGVQFFNIVF